MQCLDMSLLDKSGCQQVVDIDQHLREEHHQTGLSEHLDQVVLGPWQS